MKDNPSTKFQIPHVRLSSTEISSLIGEAVPSAARQIETVMTKPASTLQPVEHAALERQVKESFINTPIARPSPSIERLQIQLDPSVIAETKIRAVQDRTTASAIVDAALRAYLKL